MTIEEVFQDVIEPLPPDDRLKLAALIVERTPQEFSPPLDFLRGGLPDDREADEILRDLEQCRIPRTNGLDSHD